MEQRPEQGVDISKLSARELKEELAKREQLEKDELNAKRNAYLKDKDDFLFATISKFKSVQNELRELKEVTITEVNKLYKRMYEINNQEPKEQKNITQKSECGRYKVTAERKDRFEFTDEADVHIDAIKEILKKKFQDRNKGMYEFMDSILMKNGKGDYDPNLLSRAKQKAKKLGYQDLIEELQKLQDCQRVTGTALYCRAYVKDDSGKWKDIVVQFSSL